MKRPLFPVTPPASTPTRQRCMAFTPKRPNRRPPLTPMKQPVTQGNTSLDLSQSFHDISSNLSKRCTGNSDHLHHHLAFAQQMDHRAAKLSRRLNTSSNLSRSPGNLFVSATTPLKENSFLESTTKNISTQIDELNCQTFSTISRQSISHIEQISKYSDVNPEVIESQMANRFLSACGDSAHPQQQQQPTLEFTEIFHPILNCAFLATTFTSVDELAQTQLAMLYTGRHRLTGILHCLKRSRADYEVERTRGNTRLETVNEAQALALLRHDNIIQYFNSWMEAGSVFLQLEFCLGGSLFHFLHPKHALDTSSPSEGCEDSDDVSVGNHLGKPSNHLREKSLFVLLTQMVKALHYMHSCWSMVHGDVKPSNILIQIKNSEPRHLGSTAKNAVSEAKCYCTAVTLPTISFGFHLGRLT